MRNIGFVLAIAGAFAVAGCAAMMTPAQQRSMDGAALGTASGVKPPSEPFENEQSERYYPVRR